MAVKHLLLNKLHLSFSNINYKIIVVTMGYHGGSCCITRRFWFQAPAGGGHGLLGTFNYWKDCLVLSLVLRSLHALKVSIVKIIIIKYRKPERLEKGFLSVVCLHTGPPSLLTRHPLGSSAGVSSPLMFPDPRLVGTVWGKCCDWVIFLHKTCIICQGRLLRDVPPATS